jgi:hypothetical protein
VSGRAEHVEALAGSADPAGAARDAGDEGARVFRSAVMSKSVAQGSAISS